MLSTYTGGQQIHPTTPSSTDTVFATALISQGWVKGALLFGATSTIVGLQARSYTRDIFGGR